MLIEKVSVNSARNKKRARNYRSVDISISISIWEAKIWKESTWRGKGRRHFEFDPTEERSDSLRTLCYYFISFPFLSAIINQNKDAKLVPNSHPFSIEYPHQSITLAFFPSIPCFFSWLLNNKLSSRITTLSTNHQKNGRNNKFGFFHLGLLLFLWFLFCFVCCTSFLEYWNGFCCFIWNLQVYPKVKVREQDDQEDFKGPSLLPLNDDSSFPGITCSSLSYFFFLNFLFIINLI